jgi:hypothetical protein
MIQITEISSEPKQNHVLSLDQYNTINLYLEWKPQQQGWFYTVSWQGFSTNLQRIVYGLNLLRQYKNIIPFGIAVTTSNGLDPLTQDSFSSGVASFYLMGADDVAWTENQLYGG